MGDDDKVDPFAPFSKILESVSGATGEYVRGLGIVTLIWSHVELAIDLLIAVVALVEGRDNEKLPRPLESKLKKLFQSLARKSFLTEHRNEVVFIISLARTLAEKRHLIIHGALMSTLSDTEAHLMRVVRRDGEDGIDTQNITLHEIFVVLQSAIELMLRTYQLALRMLRDRFPDIAISLPDGPLFDVTQFRFQPSGPQGKR